MRNTILYILQNFNVGSRAINKFGSRAINKFLVGRISENRLSMLIRRVESRVTLSNALLPKKLLLGASYSFRID